MVVLRLSHAFLSMAAILCHSDWVSPFPKPVIWASPSHITLAIWVRVTRDAHITRILGMVMAQSRGCPYQCDIGTLEI